MSPVLERWKAQLDALSDEERAELAHYLLTAYPVAANDEAVAAAWDEEATRRAEEVRAGRATGRPLEDALADLGRHDS